MPCVAVMSEGGLVKASMKVHIGYIHRYSGSSLVNFWGVYSELDIDRQIQKA